MTAFVKSVSSWSGVGMIFDPFSSKKCKVSSSIESKSPQIMSGILYSCLPSPPADLRDKKLVPPSTEILSDADDTQEDKKKVKESTIA